MRKSVFVLRTADLNIR